MIDKSDNLKEAEPGRTSKYDSTPEEHLHHLLNIGWAADSTLIQKYLMKHNLQLRGIQNDQV